MFHVFQKSALCYDVYICPAQRVEKAVPSTQMYPPITFPSISTQKVLYPWVHLRCLWQMKRIIGTLAVMWCEAKICHLSLQNRWNMGCMKILCVRRRISICFHIKRLGGCGRYRPQACSVCLYHFYISSICNYRCTQSVWVRLVKQ